jgi:hypothetical protein
MHERQRETEKETQRERQRERETAEDGDWEDRRGQAEGDVDAETMGWSREDCAIPDQPSAVLSA